MGVWPQVCAFALLSSALAGCGTVVPDISEAWDRAKDIPETPGPPDKRQIPVSATAQIEFEIKRQIYCELKAAVKSVKYYETPTDTFPLLPDDWGANASLSLQVDESTSLNPGVALNVPMANAVSTFGVVRKVGNTIINPPTTSTPQSFSLGFGANFTATATRNDKFNSYYTVRYLLRETKPRGMCNYEYDSDRDTFETDAIAKSSPLIAQASSPILRNSALAADPDGSPRIVSQLGLTDWLVGAVFVNKAIPSVTGPVPADFPAKIDSKDLLKRERDDLRQRGYSSAQISDIVASGAFLDDVVGLEHQGYTRSEIAKYLSKGVTPPLLQQYKLKGYKPIEIQKIVAASAKVSGSKAGGGGGGGTSPDILTIEIKFIIVSNGNVTPTWKLLRVSANTGSAPLFGLGRTRTHDVIITIGPNNDATANTHLASQIGNAVGNANRAEVTPQATSILPFGF